MSATGKNSSVGRDSRLPLTTMLEVAAVSWGEDGPVEPSVLKADRMGRESHCPSKSHRYHFPKGYHSKDDPSRTVAVVAVVETAAAAVEYTFVAVAVERGHFADFVGGWRDWGVSLRFDARRNFRVGGNLKNVKKKLCPAFILVRVDGVPNFDSYIGHSNPLYQPVSNFLTHNQLQYTRGGGFVCHIMHIFS